jgi:outer membrane protein OmpA-like peptidoglycan-associated protein
LPAIAVSTDPVPWNTLLNNQAVSIESTNFVPGTIKLKPEAGMELDAVVGFAGKYPDAKLEITGYSDTKANPALSLGLADSVRNYLVTKGVAGKRITIKGAGTANPVGDNKTKEGRAKNRRVEIHSVINEESKGLVVAPAPAPAPVPVPAALIAVPAIAISTDPVPWKALLENKPVTIESTNFVPGAIKLKPEAGIELDEIVRFAGKYPDAKLEIIGYSDITNPALSLGLADSVRDYLVAKGVADSHITIKGAGAANPVGDNKTKEGRARNRRVEIHSVIKGENKGLVVAPASAPVPVPAPSPESPPEADSWKSFWPPFERRGR